MDSKETKVVIDEEELRLDLPMTMYVHEPEEIDMTLSLDGMQSFKTEKVKLWNEK